MAAIQFDNDAYRLLLERPIVVSCREEMWAALKKWTWEYRAESTATPAMMAALRGSIEPLREQFLRDSLYVVDYGFAPFEVVYTYAQPRMTIIRLKLLSSWRSRFFAHPDTGKFLGLWNGLGVINGDRAQVTTLDDPRRALWLFIPTVNEQYAEVGYGRPRLADLPDHKDETILKAFMGPGIIPTVQQLAEIACKALNRLIATLLQQNYGEEFSFSIHLHCNPAPLSPAAKPTARSHRQRQPNGTLTAKQLEAVQMFGECESNYVQTAKKLGLSRAATKERIEGAYKKLGQHVPRVASKSKTRQLPTDDQGQVLLRRRGDSFTPKGTSNNKKGRGED